MRRLFNLKVRGLVISPLLVVLVMAAAALFVAPQPAVGAVLNITPLTWNVVGLDSNDFTVGPNNFPVGARVCNNTGGNLTNIASTFVWETTDSYIDLRPGSLGTPGKPYPAFDLSSGECKDIYYEVQIERNLNAYDRVARYYITATSGPDTVTTPRPREIYVERLVSQSRNYNYTVYLNGTSIPAGGSMNLYVGQEYTISLESKTATNGYEQIESFINFPNTIFQIISISSTYGAVSGGGQTPTTTLYNDACTWENDPNSPNYRACLSTGKAGNTIVNTYTIRIIGGGGTAETLYNLVYDFSGSSYHYNADYATQFRIANIIDPASVTISKSFSPTPNNPGGVSALTITLYNPNAAAVSGANFVDSLPTLPGTMVVATPPNVSFSGCGSSASFSPALSGGETSISFVDGIVPAQGSCIIKVDVTVPEGTTGTYNNTTDPLYIGSANTGDTGSADLTVNTAPLPPACTPDLQLATWTFDTSGSTARTWQSSYVTSVAQQTNDVNASGVTTPPAGGSTFAWYATGWPPNSVAPNPYFEFTLDTSKYTGISLNFDFYLDDNWANSGDNHVYVYTSDNGGSFSLAADITTITKSTWYNRTVTPTTTGSSTTTFRIVAVGAQKNYSPLWIDDLIFTGCAVPPSPTIEKTFSPNPVAVGGESRLTFTLTNENNVSLTDVSFTDVLPAGLLVAPTPNAITTCSGTDIWLPTGGSNTLTFGNPPGGTDPAGGTIPARVGTTNGACTVAVDVIATTAGPHQNVSGFVYSAQTYANTTSTGYASASLTAVSPPQISKMFLDDPILVNGVSTIAFAITNPNPDYPLSGVGFSDTFPTGMLAALTPNASTKDCNHSTTPALLIPVDRGSISLSAASIAPGGTCYVYVDIIVTDAPGEYKNTTGNVTASLNGSPLTGSEASDTILVQNVHPSISLLKLVSLTGSDPWLPFSTITQTLPVSIYYRFVVENTGDVDLTGVIVSDPMLNPSVPNTVCTIGSLAKEASAICPTYGPVTVNTPGIIKNTASASGVYNSQTYTSELSDATYATAGLSIVKTAVETAFAGVGDELHYIYLVTNTGNAPLRGPLVVSDDKTTVNCPAVETVGDLDAYLDVGTPAGESLLCTATYVVTEADYAAGGVTNVASAEIASVETGLSQVTVNKANADYGDLPSDYFKTLQIDNGARHTIGSLFMGKGITSETNGTENDRALYDTDDGVTRLQDFINGQTANIGIDLSGTTFSGNVAVGIWIDWNNNTLFDPATDFYPCTVLAPGGSGICTITVPASDIYPSHNSVFARVRIFDPAHIPGGSLDAGDYVGLANNGEVEDYYWDYQTTAVEMLDLSASSQPAFPAAFIWPSAVALLGAGSLLAFKAWRKRA